MPYVVVYDPFGVKFELPSAKRAMQLVRDNGWTTTPKPRAAAAAAPEKAPDPAPAEDPAPADPEHN